MLGLGLERAGKEWRVWETSGEVQGPGEVAGEVTNCGREDKSSGFRLGRTGKEWWGWVAGGEVAGKVDSGQGGIRGGDVQGGVVR